MTRMSIKPTFDIRLVSPLRNADWRFQAAIEHVQRRTSPAKWEDPGIARVWGFLRDLDRADTDLKRKRVAKTWPDLSAAHAIHTGSEVQRDELQARLICEPVEVIAQKMVIPPDVITAYAETYYDTLDCQQARDWLLEHLVLAPGFHRPPTEAECWRYLALIGGPVILNLVVADYLGRPEPEYEERHYWADWGRFLVRDYAALMQTGCAADPEIVEEICRRDLERWRRTGRPIDPWTVYHLKFLRLAAGLPPCKELDRFLPERGKRVAHPSPSQPGKRNNHGAKTATDWPSIRSDLEKEILGPLNHIQTLALELRKAKTEAEVPADLPSQSKLASPEAIVA
jgi:hypothetical protein